MDVEMKLNNSVENSQDNFILNGNELVSIRSLYILQKSYNIYKTLKI